MGINYDNFIHLMDEVYEKKEVTIYDNTYKYIDKDGVDLDIHKLVNEGSDCEKMALYNSLTFATTGKTRFFIGCHIIRRLNVDMRPSEVYLIKMRLQRIEKTYKCQCGVDVSDLGNCGNDELDIVKKKDVGTSNEIDKEDEEKILNSSHTEERCIEETSSLMKISENNIGIIDSECSSVEEVDDNTNLVDGGENENGGIIDEACGKIDYSKIVMHAYFNIPMLREKDCVLVIDGMVDRRIRSLFSKVIHIDLISEIDQSCKILILTESFCPVYRTAPYVQCSTDYVHVDAFEIYQSSDGWIYYMFDCDSNGRIGNKLDKQLYFTNGINCRDVYHCHDSKSSDYMKNILDFGLRCKVSDSYIPSRSNTDSCPTVSFLSNGMKVNVKKVIDLGTGCVRRVPSLKKYINNGEMWVFSGSIVLVNEGYDYYDYISESGEKFIYATTTITFNYSELGEISKCILRVFDKRLIRDGLLKAFRTKSYLVVRSYEVKGK